MRRAVVGAAVLLVLAAVGCARFPWLGRQRVGEPFRVYIVYHGAQAFRQIASLFEEETGIHVDLRFPRRGELYDVVTKSRDGDLVVSSDRSVLDRLVKDGCGEGPYLPIGELVPVIAVVRGNPKSIWTLADLGREDVRLALSAEPRGMGTVARSIIERNRIAERVERRVVERPSRDEQTAARVDGRRVDATLMWLWAVREVGGRVEAVPIPPGQNVIEPMEAMVLNTGVNRAAAERFAAYLRYPKAREILHRAGLLTQP